MHVRWTYLVLFYKMPMCFLTIFWLNCYRFMSKCESSFYILDTSLLWSEYLCLPKMYMLNPNPKMTVLGQGPLGSGFNPWAGKVPWRRERLPTLVFKPGEFHELYSLWGHKESDMTEWLSLRSWGPNWKHILIQNSPVRVFFSTEIYAVLTASSVYITW